MVERTVLMEPGTGIEKDTKTAVDPAVPLAVAVAEVAVEHFGS